MAARPQTTYLDGYFVVSAGSVMFRRSPETKALQVCLLEFTEKGKTEWLLPKGRKDQGESIEAAALRETFEETGYHCEFLPVRMATRAPAPGINGKDASTIVDGITEPFAITIRDVGPERGVKIIWWYITKLSDDLPDKVENTQTEWEHFVSSFVDVEGAAERLTYEDDQKIVRQAVEIVGNNAL
ncbi:NUDIX hydrolase domain-like protein [Mycena floridula]|nr:NUDIX hydrolase domain-like protein [Mycena floridula]